MSSNQHSPRLTAYDEKDYALKREFHSQPNQHSPMGDEQTLRNILFCKLYLEIPDREVRRKAVINIANYINQHYVAKDKATADIAEIIGLPPIHTNNSPREQLRVEQRKRAKAKGYTRKDEV